MATKQKPTTLDVRFLLLRLCRVHFFYIGAYTLAIIIFDSWNLLTHEAVLQRWTLVATLMVINTIIWYLCKAHIKSQKFYMALLAVLLLADIIFAAINVYWQRGMASKSVLLFAVPIISAALTRSRSLLLTTAALSTAAYSLVCVRYFFGNYGQGFRVELYGEVAFYSLLFFILSGLLMIAFRPAQD